MKRLLRQYYYDGIVYEKINYRLISEAFQSAFYAAANSGEMSAKIR